MKVMYEASILGVAYSIKQKAGIFRVVETLVDNLVRYEELDFQLYSDLDFNAAAYTLEYLESRKDLDLRLSTNTILGFGISNSKKISDYFKTDPENKSVIQRLQQKKWGLTNRFLNYLDFPMLKTKDLKEADIFHSPFYPISKKISRTSAKKFITSYDIIPLLFPEHAAPGIIDVINSVVDSITPETWVLSISQSTKNDLLNHASHIDPAKVVVTELAASHYFYQNTDINALAKVRQQYNIPQQQYILSLCTLEPRKNIDHLIRAFYHLIKQEHIEDLSLVLVGTKGWNFDSIFNQITSDPVLRNKVIITGFVPDEDLAAIYSNALCFVYPSLYEGFGLPPLEAMQCGTPVITSNTSSLPEVVGNAGIMLSPHDLDGLSDAIYEIYSSSSYRSELVEKSLLRAKHFSWSRCADETVAAYRKALQS